MTRTQVEEAITALQNRGEAVSDRKILREIGSGSLRDVLRYRRDLQVPLDWDAQTADLEVLVEPLIPLAQAILDLATGLAQWEELRVQYRERQTADAELAARMERRQADNAAMVTEHTQLSDLVDRMQQALSAAETRSFQVLEGGRPW